MTSLNIEKISESLKNKILLGLEYFDKKNEIEDSFLELTFSDFYKLRIHTFWRIYDDKRIYAMDTERYLLTNYIASENDYQNLSLKDSLLSKNLRVVRKKCLGTTVKNVRINDTNDIFIELNNFVTVQGLINCRCNLYTYYSLFCNDKNIVKCCINWTNN